MNLYRLIKLILKVLKLIFLSLYSFIRNNIDVIENKEKEVVIFKFI